MAGGGTPIMGPSSDDDEYDRARRVEARAADDRTCDSVLRTARRLMPLISVVEGGGEMTDDEATTDGSMSGGVSSDIAGGDCMEEWRTLTLSNMSLAGAGITPPGNDDDSDIGSSLTGGHISDPLP